VKTNPDKPFLVTGKNLCIVAEGTSFNVKAWEDTPETVVVLVEGKVNISFLKKQGQGLSTTLKPGQMFHYSHDVSSCYLQSVNVEKHIAWTEGKLVFREDPFSEVVKRINRWYNVNIVIKDEILKSYEYVATFQDETLDEILKMLAISAPISYRELKRHQREDGTFEKRTIELYYKPNQ
jgi:ferric-dicitrate binding protein FerR (iron transport regulator)